MNLHSLRAVLESAGVVDGDLIAGLGEVRAVAGGEELLVDTHSECCGGKCVTLDRSCSLQQR